MPFLKIILLLISVIFASAASAYEPPANESRLVLDRQGIKIWAYQVPDSPLYGFKAVTTVKSTLSGLVALIGDTNNAHKWIYKTKAIDLLERNDSARTFAVRVVTDFPWPFRDRDAVVVGSIDQDPHTLRVRIDSHSAQKPVKDCCVRMPMVEGSWILKPLPAGMVEITMTGHADPGGYIPAGAVNLLVQQYPFYTLKGLRKIIGESLYQQSQLAFITEPPPIRNP
jgi:hypothetical protein